MNFQSLDGDGLLTSGVLTGKVFAEVSEKLTNTAAELLKNCAGTGCCSAGTH